MIFAVEWNSDDIMPYQSCISNGVRDKEKYLLWLKQNPDSEWMQNFPEIKNHKTNYRTLDQIAPGTEYVYLIPIKNTTYFLPKFASGFDISSRVYDDVKNGNAIIVFDYNHEGNIKYDLAPVNQLVSTLGLPKEKVLLLHADFNVTKFQNDFYTYQPIDIFATWIRNDFRELPGVIDYQPEKLYICHNRMLHLRPQRLLLLSYLKMSNLLNDGFVSIGDTNNLHNDNFHYFDRSIPRNIISEIISLGNSSPDGKKLVTDNPANIIDIANVGKSFLTLVSETLWEPDISFFSEKIYKPLSVGHPFILIGNQYSLQRLQEMGFKTFSNWWDESYDTITDLKGRVKTIVELLAELNTWSVDKRITVRQEMIPTLLHNKQLFNSLRNKQFGDVLQILNNTLAKKG